MIRTICSSNSKRDYELRELHESLRKRIRVIRVIRSRSIFVVLIIKFKVQTSNFKGTTNYANCTNHLAKEFVSLEKFVVVRSSDHKVQSPNFKFQRDYELRELHESLNKRIRVIRAIRSRSIFVVLIIKFKVQSSMLKGNSYFTV